MYKKAVYHFNIYAGTVTDPEQVTTDFMHDIRSRVPVNVSHNSSRVFVQFRDPDYIVAYTMPLDYQKYTGGIEK